MASKGINLTLATARFNRMLRELAAVDTSVEFADVVRHEAGAVAQLALDQTKAAKVANIKARNAAQKFTTFNGKTYFIHRNYRDPKLRQGLLDAWQASLKTKIGARGISKQSWYHVGRSFGRNMEAPAYVLAANYNGQQWPSDGTSVESRSPKGFTLAIENSSPVVQKANGGFALQVGMNKRTAYFARNMKYKYYETVRTRALKYPGLYMADAPPPPID